MSMQDRPARTKPRPPADAGVDPIVHRPSAPVAMPAKEGDGYASATTADAPTKTAVPKIGGGAPAKEVTVQSGVSWSLDIEALVAQAKERTGKTRRAIVEEAIAAMWAD